MSNAILTDTHSWYINDLIHSKYTPQIIKFMLKLTKYTTRELFYLDDIGKLQWINMIEENESSDAIIDEKLVNLFHKIIANLRWIRMTNTTDTYSFPSILFKNYVNAEHESLMSKIVNDFSDEHFEEDKYDPIISHTIGYEQEKSLEDEIKPIKCKKTNSTPVVGSLNSIATKKSDSVFSGLKSSTIHVISSSESNSESSSTLSSTSSSESSSESSPDSSSEESYSNSFDKKNVLGKYSKEKLHIKSPLAQKKKDQYSHLSKKPFPSEKINNSILAPNEREGKFVMNAFGHTINSKSTEIKSESNKRNTAIQPGWSKYNDNQTKSELPPKKKHIPQTNIKKKSFNYSDSDSDSE
jgi:hypothetical protein